MKARTLATSCLLAVLAFHFGASAASIIAQWTFEGGRLVSSTGTGTLSLLGVKGALVSGDPGQALNTSVYPAQFTGNKREGVQFNVSTAGSQKILITWDQRVSPTASMYGRLQYTTNGTTYLDFATPNVMSSVDTFESKVCDLTGYAGVNNNSNFAFRIVTEFESTAIGNTLACDCYVTESGTAYYTVGTVRFDNVTVSGDELPKVDPTPTLSAPTLSVDGSFNLLVSGAQGASYVVQASDAASGGNWIPLQTNSGSFTFRDKTAGFAQRFYRVMLSR